MKSLLRIRPSSDRNHHRSGVSPAALSALGTPCTTTTAAAASVTPGAASAGISPRMGCSPAASPTMRQAYQRSDRPQRSSMCLTNAASTSTWLSPSSTPADGPESIQDALDWKPRLPLPSTLLCLTISAAATSIAAALLLSSPSRTPTLTLRHAAALALVFLAALSFTRSFLLERLYLAHTRSETQLGDPTSCFLTFSGVTAHFKSSLYGHAITDPSQRSAKDRLSPPPAPPPSTTNPNPGAETTAVHCYHGFGANLYSFEPVHRRLSSALSALVTSHDMPGFGLTSRPPAGHRYYLAFNGRLGRGVQDHELSRLGLLVRQPKQQEPEPAGEPPPSSSNSSSTSLCSMSSAVEPGTAPELGSQPKEQQLAGVDRSSDTCAAAAAGSAPQPAGQGAAVKGRVKRVLMGHSMGAICAALQALEAAEDVAALVLVAPAILVMPGTSKLSHTQLQALPPLEGTAAVGGSEIVRRFAPSTLPTTSTPSTPAPHTSARSQHVLLRLAVQLGRTLHAALLLCVLLLLRLLRPLLVWVLRAVVRSRAFWVQGLSQAWYDKSKLTDKALDEYRLPQLVRGWEAGMCRFIEARLAPVSLADLWALWRVAPKPKPPGQPGDAPKPGDDESWDDGGHGANLVEELAAAVRRRGAAGPLRVLLVHGRGDALVPVENTERLARALAAPAGGADGAVCAGSVELAVLERCGHMPHEEWPELFTQLVAEFLSRGAEPSPAA